MFYIPRKRMPQIDSKDLPRLCFAALAKCGIVYEKTVDVRELHYHQHVSQDKVNAMPASLLRKPLLISDDHFVIDGNHRAHAHLARGQYNCKCIVLSMPFKRALRWLETLAFVYHITPVTPERN